MKIQIDLVQKGPPGPMSFFVPRGKSPCLLASPKPPAPSLHPPCTHLGLVSWLLEPFSNEKRGSEKNEGLSGKVINAFRLEDNEDRQGMTEYDKAAAREVDHLSAHSAVPEGLILAAVRREAVRRQKTNRNR